MAASRAFAASIDLFTIFFACEGFFSKYSPNESFNSDSTIPAVSEFPNLVFVCPSNLGSGTFILTTEVNPSLVSSPVICIF